MAGSIITSLGAATKSAQGGKAYYESRRYNSRQSLIFISHRQNDGEVARKLAHFLVDFADVDVYMEAFNPTLASSGNPQAVVDVIDFGLNACTHLIAIISDNTRGSWWVPYEIGIARNRPVPCAVMPLTNVLDLPEYMKTVEVVRDTNNLVLWTKRLFTTRVAKSVSPNSIDIPNFPTYRQTPIVFRD
ncbi:toll/interleukin-1 receptor domain-containing protein [Deinococcus sp. Leaf326]|uniref:toll/interleukin-1 receptor domain-containing protein n=1 Tax=Deinococcus sp. Leaf326 TaxID=1736338 RepID=UPI0009EA40EB|nr:toll/interleukin-1 receptor domain-containing protein [Deinococcus sp. Leaf326]